MQYRLFSRLGGMDGRLEILKVRCQGCKLGNTQGLVEGMSDKKYSWLVGRVERLKILKVSSKG